MPEAPGRLRATDLLDIPVPDDITGYELVNGELVPIMPAKRPHSWLCVEVAAELRNWVKAKGIGAVYGDVWMRVPRREDRERVRAPDVAYYSNEKLALAGSEEIFSVPPDLAVEIHSSTSYRKSGDFQQRIRDFLDAGARLLWVIHADAGYAMIYRADGSARMIRETEALDGEDVLPGFRLELGPLLQEIP